MALFPLVLAVTSPRRPVGHTDRARTGLVTRAVRAIIHDMSATLTFAANVRATPVVARRAQRTNGRACSRLSLSSRAVVRWLCQVSSEKEALEKRSFLLSARLTLTTAAAVPASPMLKRMRRRRGCAPTLRSPRLSPSPGDPRRRGHDGGGRNCAAQRGPAQR